MTDLSQMIRDSIRVPGEDEYLVTYQSGKEEGTVVMTADELREQYTFFKCCPIVDPETGETVDYEHHGWQAHGMGYGWQTQRHGSIWVFWTPLSQVVSKNIVIVEPSTKAATFLPIEDATQYSFRTTLSASGELTTELLDIEPTIMVSSDRVRRTTARPPKVGSEESPGTHRE